MMRKYLPTLAELIERLAINQLKEIFIPDAREQYAEEIQDILHDIQLLLDNPKIGSPSDEEEIHFGPFSPMKITRKTVRGLTAEVIRDIIIIAQYNLHIWHNESEARKGNDAGNNLLLTHS